MAKIIADGINMAVVKVVEAPSYDEIAERAYFIYEARGGDHGLDIDDWLQAEAELLAERSGDFGAS
jgi:hypothetical protein